MLEHRSRRPEAERLQGHKPPYELPQLAPILGDTYGTILYQGNRVSAALAFQFPQAGQTVPLQVWRDGQQTNLDLPVTVYEGDKAADPKAAEEKTSAALKAAIFSFIQARFSL